MTAHAQPAELHADVLTLTLSIPRSGLMHD